MDDRDETVVEGRFSALGHAGSGSFIGLEIIDLAEELTWVQFDSDEFTALCPVTGQPDQYKLKIELRDTVFSLESKSLKIYLNQFRNKGAFAEALIVKIREDIFSAIRKHDEESDKEGTAFFTQEQIQISITQKRRGGIEIWAST